jgi:hypothetical protein
MSQSGIGTGPMRRPRYSLVKTHRTSGCPARTVAIAAETASAQWYGRRPARL